MLIAKPEASLLDPNKSLPFIVGSALCRLLMFIACKEIPAGPKTACKR